MLFSNHFLEPKHFIVFPHILHDVETAFVDVEVDVALLEIGCAGLPNFHFRMQLLHGAPGGIADAFAVRLGRDKQQLQLAMVAFDAKHHTADLFPIQKDTIGFAIVDGLLDGVS